MLKTSIARLVAMASALSCALCLAALARTSDDQRILALIQKRLGEPERVTYNKPIVFVGDIDRFGPVFQGVCKQGVGEDVDFEVLQWVHGEGQRNNILTSYINCTHQPLPSAPFTLKAKVIVYCERPNERFVCLNPVAYSDARLMDVQLWSASIHPTPRR